MQENGVPKFNHCKFILVIDLYLQQFYITTNKVGNINQTHLKEHANLSTPVHMLHAMHNVWRNKHYIELSAVLRMVWGQLRVRMTKIFS
jgi:hypothetical protein